ncbi:MAG TPA: DUF3570 domain-containing protein [Polyangiaceae bacterium]|jgi:hypothetical protein|nr:DUF3570 domain-containing protein [Polyangiaceae bacterium]
MRSVRSFRSLGVAALAVFSLSSPASASSGADAPDRTANEHADTAPKDAAPGKATPKDTAVERASFEMAGYQDNDAVTVFTPSIALGIDNASGATLRATYLVDIVSAASVDIVSTASPRWQEVRQAGSVYGEYKPRDFGVGVGASLSREPDYLSYGAYATVRKDFSEKNWSLFFGYGLSHDTAGRCGADGACTPFSVFSRNLLRESFNLGVDLVVDRQSLLTVTGDLVVEDGDQSKPYRYVPMFTPEKAALVKKGESIKDVNDNRSPERPLEQLPLTRRRFAVTARYARRIGNSTLRASQRVYDDTWGLIASSTDARIVFDVGKRFAVWPHLRFNVQRAVNFWKLAYVSRGGTGWDLPEYRTGDRELGPLWTAGGGFGVKWYIGGAADPERFAVQLSGDAMYTSFLDDLYLTSRIAGLGALGVEGAF